jgi:16S rRNA processing protein RimM
LRQGAEWVAADVSEGKRHGKSVIARLAGVDDRDQAAVRVGCDIAVARKDLPEIEEGTYYFTDLEGMRVVHRDGTELGTVAYMMETGANDVMVTEGERERLIPFIKETVILDVDLEKNVISVDWEWD